MMREVNVYNCEGEKTGEKVVVPELFNTELRPDLVRQVFENVRKNSRQPYAVSPDAGMQHSAESWGTGRAIARVPRVKASGTRRAGQAAFANFARKGRMAFPTSPNRRWGRKTCRNMRRLACCIGVAATANPAIVEGRGHRIENTKEFPIVVSDEITQIQKTCDVNNALIHLGLGDDLERVKESKCIRAGKGKWRNRRYRKRVGVLLVHSENIKTSAFNKISGVDIENVNSLNVLNVCPGGQLGRLVVFTKSAFESLSKVFSDECKKGFSLPIKTVTNNNLDEYFYSPEIQKIINVPSLLPVGTTKKSETEITKAKELIDLY